MCAAVALLLSYVETLIPPIYPAVPGIKIGLPNVIVIFLLYRFGVAEAALVSFLRVIISSMLFGTPFIFFYSLAGAFLSLAVMSVLKKLDFMTSVGVSIAGGISHNLGQILLAMVLLNTAELGYYIFICNFCYSFVFYYQINYVTAIRQYHVFNYFLHIIFFL